ncbi:MAG: hypothetical protein WCX82_02930 [archaeon]|jgi:cell division protein FtsL
MSIKKSKKIQKKLFEDSPIKLSPKKKNLYLLIAVVIIILIILVAVLVNKDKNNSTNNEITETESQITTTNNAGTTNNNSEIITNNTINASSTLEDFYATKKPSFIVFAGTYCGHCKILVPELETEIWDNYSTKANIWINVIDGKDGKVFPVTEIAQGYNPNLDYDAIMGDCGYVPAYVVLDKTGKEILRSCGTEKTIDEVKAALDSQLN